MSLRRRLLVGIAVVVAVLVVTNLALASAVEDYLLHRVDQQLATTVNQPVFDAGRRAGPPFLRDDPADEPLTDLFLAVADLEAGTLTRFGTAIREDEPPALTPTLVVDQAGTVGTELDPFTVPSADGTSSWRVAAVTRWEGSAEVLVVGVRLDDVTATMARLRLAQVAGTLAVLLALAAVASWVLRLGVRPLVEMAGTADEIAAGDLSRRVDLVDDRTEAGRLGIAFNSMLSEIEEAFRQREASEERVRRFAADASHELRTPLTSIRGYADLWRAGGLRDPGQLDEAMRRMAAEAARMGALVEDLLLLARLDQHRPLERAPVRFDELVADAVGDARAVEPDRPVTLEAEPVVVDGDQLRLRQLVGNLLANARAHTPAGTPVAVRVGPAEGGAARLDVRDEGPGMAPDVAARVFERFYRADAARARSAAGTGPAAGESAGTGLGLSIVAAVAAAHGGRASVASTPGAGACFTVALPAVEAVSAPPDGSVPS